MRRVWVRKFSSFDEERQADREYWAAIPPDDRVAILDEMRAEWASWKGHGEQGLRRTVRIVELPER
jgi:hypothetical protein